MRELIFLTPHLTHNIWGGTRLREEFGYEIEGNDIGECWGIAAHPNGSSVVRGGSYDGLKLSELYETHRELFGGLTSPVFPLLVKIIDANDNLSIQVHPDDAYAKVHENGSLGKTECWYILDCPEGAELVIGHNAKDRKELASMIHEGRWTEFIRKVPVKKGDFIQIDPGTVHAITAGVLILETQQNSDITYRVYDYDRLQNGKPRQLHIEQSIDVITVPAKSAEGSVLHTSEEKGVLQEIYANEFYRVMKIELDDAHPSVSVDTADCPFMELSLVEGEGRIDGREVKKGDHLIAPAGYGTIRLEGALTAILSTVKK